MEQGASASVNEDQDVSVIKEGDQVVFHREGWSRVFQIRQKRQIYLDKSKLDIDALIGQPYGTTFEVDRGRLQKLETVSSQVAHSDIAEEPGIDNRNLLDLDSNQKMSKEDIMKMKGEGVTGQKIIEELIENSETFKAKTEFSREKYLKKKKKKHIPVFTVLRPTPRLVMDIFSKEPAKICYLRADSLSQLLSYSNAMYGSCVGVVETCQGLVLSSLLQRVGDAGKVLQLIPNATNAVCRQVMDYLGYAKNTDNVYTFPLDEISSLTDPINNSQTSKNGTTDVTSTKAAEEKTKCSTEPDLSKTEAANNTEDSSGVGEQLGDVTSTVDGNGQAEKENETGDQEDEVKTNEGAPGSESEKNNGEKRGLGPIREMQRQRRADRQQIAGDIIREKKLDSLVIAAKYNPTPILLKMLEFLRPSVPVVVYCQHLEPLVECYTRVKEKHSGLQLKLSETWFRQYQILPQRTHPMINMSGTGGYLFTFTTSQSNSTSRR